MIDFDKNLNLILINHDWFWSILKQGSQILSDLCSIRETDNDEYGIHEYQLELSVKLKPLKIQQEANANKGEESERQPKLDLNVYYRCRRD